MLVPSDKCSCMFRKISHSSDSDLSWETLQWKVNPEINHSRPSRPSTFSRNHPVTYKHIQTRPSHLLRCTSSYIMDSTWYSLRSSTLWMVRSGTVPAIPFLSRCFATYSRFWCEIVFFLNFIYWPNERNTIYSITFSTLPIAIVLPEDRNKEINVRHT